MHALAARAGDAYALCSRAAGLPPDARECRGQLVHVFLLMLCWYCISIGIIFYNKWLMRRIHFGFPLVVTTIYMAVKIPLGWLAVRCTGRAGLATGWRLALTRIVPLALLTSVDISLSMSSYLFVSTTLITTVKSSAPLWQLLWGLLLRTEVLTPQLVGVVALASGGLLLATYSGGVSKNPFRAEGLALIVSATCLAGLRGCLMQLTLQPRRRELLLERQRRGAYGALAYGALGALGGPGQGADEAGQREGTPLLAAEAGAEAGADGALVHDAPARAAPALLKRTSRSPPLGRPPGDGGSGRGAAADGPPPTLAPLPPPPPGARGDAGARGEQSPPASSAARPASLASERECGRVDGSVSVDGSVDAVRLTYLLAPWTTAFSAALMAALEWRRFAESDFVAHAPPRQRYETLCMLLGAGSLVFVLVLVELKIVELTSALTLSVAGALKECITIGGAHFVLHDRPLSALNVGGLACSLVGIHLYQRSRLAAPPPLPPAAMEDSAALSRRGTSGRRRREEAGDD